MVLFLSVKTFRTIFKPNHAEEKSHSCVVRAHFATRSVKYKNNIMSDDSDYEDAQLEQEEDENLDLSRPEVVDKYRAAADIANGRSCNCAQDRCIFRVK